MEKLKVEIWSDIRCPFCYLGKRRFEIAFDQFQHKNNVEIEWHSFQLDPYLVTQPGINVYDHLAEVKGISREQSIQAHQQIVMQGRELGIEYNFEKAIVANSFNAHRLAHIAKNYQLQNEVEERLFKAYFTKGENISDIDTLIGIGKEVGLPADLLNLALNSDEYTDNVLMDQSYARELGINAVPYFLFNERLTVRGAQQPDMFLRALLKAWELTHNPESTDGKSKTYFLRNF